MRVNLGLHETVLNALIAEAQRQDRDGEYDWELLALAAINAYHDWGVAQAARVHPCCFRPIPGPHMSNCPQVRIEDLPL